MLTLSRILEVDSVQPSSHALRDAVGDNFLYRHNRIFANVRDACRGFGYRFSADGELWRDYLACPLLCLQTILDDRCVPYLENASTLRRFMARHTADFSISARFLIQILSQNHVLHESAHCIAHEILSAQAGGPDLTARERAVRQALLAEAYANTVESFASVLAAGAAHVLYFSLNSYVRPELEKRDRLAEAVARFGVDPMFRIAFLTFLINNIACRPATEEELRIAAALVLDDPSDEAVAELHAVAGQALSLNSGFLEKTTPVWFTFLGCEAEYGALRGATISPEFLNELNVGRALDEFAAVTLAGVEMRALAASA
jgi:hypothetical protein